MRTRTWNRYRWLVCLMVAAGLALLPAVAAGQKPAAKEQPKPAAPPPMSEQVMMALY